VADFFVCIKYLSYWSCFFYHIHFEIWFFVYYYLFVFSSSFLLCLRVWFGWLAACSSIFGDWYINYAENSNRISLCTLQLFVWLFLRFFFITYLLTWFLFVRFVCYLFPYCLDFFLLLLVCFFLNWNCVCIWLF